MHKRVLCLSPAQNALRKIMKIHLAILMLSPKAIFKSWSNSGPRLAAIRNSFFAVSILTSTLIVAQSAVRAQEAAAYLSHKEDGDSSFHQRIGISYNMS